METQLVKKKKKIQWIPLNNQSASFEDEDKNKETTKKTRKKKLI